MTHTQEHGTRPPALMAVGSTELVGEIVPERVLVVPWGQVTSSSGSFVVDSQSAAEVLARFETGGNDLPIDYEHQTLGGHFSSPDGRAPAAGWIKSLEAVEAEGIFALVEWTDSGKKVLGAKEYRYLSPVALVDRDSGRMVALHSAALTNKPAIPAMTPIVNAHEVKPTDGNESARFADSVAAMDRLREQLGIDADAPVEEVLACAGRRLGELTDRVRRDEAAALVNAAARAGKCTESQRQWATSLAMRDPQAFEAWQQCAPVVVQTGRLEAPGPETSSGQRARSVVHRARADYRREKTLQLLTSEEAYVKLALREAGLDDQPLTIV